MVNFQRYLQCRVCVPWWWDPKAVSFSVGQIVCWYSALWNIGKCSVVTNLKGHLARDSFTGLYVYIPIHIIIIYTCFGGDCWHSDWNSVHGLLVAHGTPWPIAMAPLRCLQSVTRLIGFDPAKKAVWEWFHVQVWLKTISPCLHGSTNLNMNMIYHNECIYMYM